MKMSHPEPYKNILNKNLPSDVRQLQKLVRFASNPILAANIFGDSDEAATLLTRVCDTAQRAEEPKIRELCLEVHHPNRSHPHSNGNPHI